MSRTDHNTHDLDRMANKRAGRKMGWHLHAMVFSLVNLGLIATAALGGYHWHIFQGIGWALGLFIHGLVVFVFMPGNGLRERMVERERALLTVQLAAQAVQQRDPW